ncbi:complement C5-like [Ovis canadensis]|uniref:complement C5-like n=1 Tax=Ovis canadensis TaxID=37174 RepID=UPI0038B652F3
MVLFTSGQLKVRTDDPDLSEEYQASHDYQAVAYSSRSQSFPSLSWTDSYITVTPKSPCVGKITHYNYVISSKGRAVRFGTERKLPGSS